MANPELELQACMAFLALQQLISGFQVYERLFWTGLSTCVCDGSVKFQHAMVGSVSPTSHTVE